MSDAIMNEKVQAIFYKAIELPKPHQMAFLEQECGEDTALLQDIKSLLSTMDDSEVYFNEFSYRLSNIDINKNDTSYNEDVQLGAWTLLSPLGEGGMGCVYLAKRTGQQYEQKAALKTLSMGANDSISRYRFNCERKILAQLHHENIARFIDGGMTEDGMPYFVMEYVNGLSIEKFCAHKKFDIEAILKLFLKVCDAVQYAHNHLVVHRDLKPNNVLVDEKDNVKLLDFGVAKILEPNENNVELTKLALCPLTLGYASPEMLKGEQVGIASDIYSLGAMLYELLTGKKPYSTDVTVVEFIKKFDREATCPSHRAIDEKWRKLLRGDLDNIILKAISNDSNLRYASVKHFSDDIERFLNGYPIRATPYNTVYHASKFIRRHQAATLAVLIVFFSLISAAVFSFRQMQEARLQRDLALYQQRHVQASNDFIDLLFEVIGPQGEALTLEELLDRGVFMLDNQFEEKPAFMANIYFELSQAYNSLGNKNKMSTLLKKSEQLAKQKGDWDLLSSVLCAQSNLNFRLDPEFSKQQYQKALHVRAKLAIPTLKNTIMCNLAYARLLEDQGDIESALNVIDKTLTHLQETEEIVGTFHVELINRKTLLFYSLGRQEEVLESNKKLLMFMEVSGRASTISYMIVMQNRAILLNTAGEIIESVKLRKSVLDRFASAHGNQQPPVKFHTRYADGLMRLAKYDEALALYLGNIEELANQGDRFEVAHNRLNIGKIYTTQGNYVEAEIQLSKAEDEYNKSPSSNKRQINRVYLAKVRLLRERGEIHQALFDVEKLLVKIGYPENKKGFLLSQILREAAEVSLQVNDLASAEKYIEAFYETTLSLAIAPEDSADVGYAKLLRGQLLFRLNDKKQALENIKSAINTLTHSAGDDHPHTVAAKKIHEKIAGG